jgi:hypothetical protein
VPHPLTDDEFGRLLKEPDPFKLAIRGHAAIEAMINDAIVEAVEGCPAKDLLRLPFRTRLAFAVALGLIVPEHKAMITALAKLRNDFAHGDLQHLTAPRVRTMMQVFVPLLPQEARQLLRDASPRASLVMVLIAVRAVVAATVAASQARRAEERRIVGFAAWQRVQAERREAFRRALLAEFQEEGLGDTEPST